MNTITRIPAFNDNYIWLTHNDEGQAIVVDPGDASVVMSYLNDNNLVLTDILVTHHHPDHIGGIDTLLTSFPGCQVYGPPTERFHMVTHPVYNHDVIAPIACDTDIQVFNVPGHTSDHVAYLYADNLFVGDTLFSVGCGRLFEGSPADMMRSLKALSQLDKNTKIFCAHEYTIANCDFALAVTPTNTSLVSYAQQAKLVRAAQKATIPSLLATELLVNPFLRTDKSDVRQAIIEKYSLSNDASELEIFTKLRAWKDTF